MASIGHGISDAVRNHIPVWVDDKLVEALYEEHQKAGGEIGKLGVYGFKSKIRSPGAWIRKSRKHAKDGYERLYHCKNVAKAKLIVYSPEDDKSANAYVFYIGDKAVAGGKTKLKSTHITTNVSSKDKTSLNPTDIQFVKFTEEELQTMRIQTEFGGGLDRLEFDRGE